jgi:hypothetical protein
MAKNSWRAWNKFLFTALFIIEILHPMKLHVEELDRTKIKYEFNYQSWSTEYWFLCIALVLNKAYHPMKFQVQSFYSLGEMGLTKIMYEYISKAITQWTRLLSMKINKGQWLKNHEVQSTNVCSLHFFYEISSQQLFKCSRIGPGKNKVWNKKKLEVQSTDFCVLHSFSMRPIMLWSFKPRAFIVYSFIGEMDWTKKVWK